MSAAPHNPDVPSQWVIETEDLAAGYTDELVLDGISIRIPAGKTTCVIGGSGHGKSTLLRCLIGLLEPRRGTVRLLGEDLYALGEKARTQLLARVGFMFQYGAMLNSISLFENIAIPLRAHTDLPEDVIAEVIKLKLAQVGLAKDLHKLPGELSGGMRKRAGLARSIALDPPLLLCDEPSAGLDPLTAARLDELLLRTREVYDITMVVVTHEVQSILTIADEVVMMMNGAVRFHGPLVEALESSDPALTTFFGRKSEGVEAPGRTLYEALATGAESP